MFVCLSTGGESWSLSRGSLSRGVSVHVSLSRGVYVQGGLYSGCLCPGDLCLGVSIQEDSLSGRPPCPLETPSDRDPSSPYGNERALRILLECILVTFITSNRSLPKDSTFDFKHASTLVETNLGLLQSYFGISILLPFFWSYKKFFAHKLATFKVSSTAF